MTLLACRLDGTDAFCRRGSIYKEQVPWLSGEMMASATISLADMVRDAVAFHKEGRLDEAAALYQAALRMEPRNADALHLLGVIDHQRGDHERAVTRIRQCWRSTALDRIT